MMTVLTQVLPDAELGHEAILGSVVAIQPFSSEEMLGSANAGEFGLAWCVYTTGLKRGLAIAEKFEAGMGGLLIGRSRGTFRRDGAERARRPARGMLEYLNTKATRYISVSWQFGDRLSAVKRRAPVTMKRTPGRGLGF